MSTSTSQREASNMGSQASPKHSPHPVSITSCKKSYIRYFNSEGIAPACIIEHRRKIATVQNPGDNVLSCFDHKIRNVFCVKKPPPRSCLGTARTAREHRPPIGRKEEKPNKQAKKQESVQDEPACQANQEVRLGESACPADASWPASPGRNGGQTSNGSLSVA